MTTGDYFFRWRKGSASAPHPHPPCPILLITVIWLKNLSMERNACFEGHTSLNYVSSSCTLVDPSPGPEEEAESKPRIEKNVCISSSLSSIVFFFLFSYWYSVWNRPQELSDTCLWLSFSHRKLWGTFYSLLFRRRLTIIHCLVWPWYLLQRSVSRKRII